MHLLEKSIYTNREKKQQQFFETKSVAPIEKNLPKSENFEIFPDENFNQLPPQPQLCFSK